MIRYKNSKVVQKNALVYESHDFLGQMPTCQVAVKCYLNGLFFMMTYIVMLGTHIEYQYEMFKPIIKSV